MGLKTKGSLYALAAASAAHAPPLNGQKSVEYWELLPHNHVMAEFQQSWWWAGTVWSTTSR